MLTAAAIARPYIRMAAHAWGAITLLLLGAADAGCYDYMACGQCPDGCVWCPYDLICAPENNVPTGSSLYLSGYTAITCDADDYVDGCDCSNSSASERLGSHSISLA